jgi:octaprenyl-diphosphate synthase
VLNSKVQPVNLSTILEPIAADMQQVDAVIRQRLQSEVPLILTISEYIIASGGKRLRPALVLLVARALGHDSKAMHELAAVVEFIHTATLLHDDVVDESSLRRGRQTANAAFGNAASVLVGDFLYSRAFQMMVGVDRMPVLQVLADATNVIAEGEVLQMLNMHDPDITEAAYLRVIRYKTAKLFEAAGEIAAILSDVPSNVRNQAAEYGRTLGTAFQLVDDALDYSGNTEALGKNVGDDLREGKPTLPLIVAMQRGSASERERIRAAIREGDTQHLAEIEALIRRCGALEATYEQASAEAKRAADLVAGWPKNAATEALIDLSAFAVARSY